ncbi:MAG: hypothetical protein AABW75_01625 [Nanoarchaeota archaeon]
MIVKSNEYLKAVRSIKICLRRNGATAFDENGNPLGERGIARFILGIQYKEYLQIPVPILYYDPCLDVYGFTSETSLFGRTMNRRENVGRFDFGGI